MKTRSSQAKFSHASFKEKLSFGGDLLKKSANRHARPISSRESMHVILKSSKATGRYSFRHEGNGAKVRHLIESQATKYGARLLSFSNNFNHLHLHLRFTSRALYLRFIRSVTATLAIAITGANKNRSLRAIFGTGGFWDSRPFTRVIKGLRGVRIVNDYIRLNQLEAEGVIPKRKGRLRDLLSDEKVYFVHA